MDISSQIKIMQAIRGVNNTQTANLLDTTKQNFTNKCSRNNFRINELQKISDTLGFDMDIVFTDRKSGKKI